MKRIAILAAGVIGALIVYYSLRPNASTPVARKNYNLILISIDTVRSDYLEVYNPLGAPTPNLKRIASEATIFTDVISQVPLTLPSHCSMFTGDYPMKLLVQDNIGGKLPSSSVTIAEVFKNNGYQTAGFAGAFVLASNTGINQGFDVYDENFPTARMKKGQGVSSLQRNAEEVASAFQRWFSSRSGGNYFAFLHFYDPHSPYDPPPDFHPVNATEEELYKGELRYVDSVIGKLFDDLSARGVWKDTVLVITSDHGEMLGEHREKGHGYFIYQPALKVPLMIRTPDSSSSRHMDQTIELVDLMPTMLDLTGIPPPENLQGNSFAALMYQKPVADGYAFSESFVATRNFGTAPLRSIQDRRYKYIETARPELYDISTDIHEEHNIYPEKKELAARMQTKLKETVDRFAADEKTVREERKVSAEDLERFAALGYIGGTELSPDVDHSRDAKDYIEQWRDLNDLLHSVSQGKYHECLDIVSRLRKAGYLPLSGRIAEAAAYAGLHDFKKGISILKEILRDDPGNLQALYAIADAYDKAGMPDHALSIYKELWEKQRSAADLQTFAFFMIRQKRENELRTYLEQLESSGSASDAYADTIGEIYYYLKEPQKAYDRLSKAFEKNPDNFRTLTLLAAIMDYQGNAPKALQLMERNENKFSDADFLHQLGMLYHKTGNSTREIATFEKLIRLHPKDPRGYVYLAKILLDSGGDTAQVIQLAQTGIALSSTPDYQIFGNDVLSEAFSKAGKTAEAKISFERARKLETQVQ